MSEDSIAIIKELRDARLGWIADELVESIALGRQTTKAFRESGSVRATRASAVEPFTPSEEMALIVETFAQYFIRMPEAWKMARAHFAKPDTFAKVHLEEQPSLFEQIPVVGEGFAGKLGITGDGEGPFHDFDDTYLNEVLPSLWRVLRALWPTGTEDFEKRFPEPEQIAK